MAASSVAEQVTDDGQTLDELIEQKVENEVDRRVTEETAELRRELEAERTRRRMLERALGERDRDIRRNQATNQELNYAVAMLANELTGADVNFNDEPATQKDHFTHLGDIIDDLEAAVARHESIIEEQGTASGNSKDQKWQDTIETAENLKDHSEHNIGDGWVKLFKENIVAATGCCDRRAAQLIDEWDEEKSGTNKNEYKHVTTSRKTEGSNIQRKALKIDLDVWGDD